MMRVAAALAAVIAMGFTITGLSTTNRSTPEHGRQEKSCQEDDRYRQFDFWIGSWDVYDPDRQVVGHNAIRPEEAGCVLIERWNGAGGSSGLSINYFDPSDDVWRQYWVAAAGWISELEGGIVDGAMVMQGKLIRQNGTFRPFRGTWTPLEDGRVRQHFEIADTARTWSTWFDGYYERVDE